MSETAEARTEEREQPRMFDIRRYEFVMRAAQPIAHHAESIGNEAIVMRKKVRCKGGFALVPIISGDTMRHGMREAAAYALLDAAGLLNDPQLTEAAIRLLFAGGMVTGKGEAAVVKLDQYREMCELVPSMALFGGCANNRILPGRLTVEEATLICEEAAADMPPWALDLHRKEYGDLDGCRAYVEEVQRVRMDPSLTPHVKALMAPSEQVEVNARLAASEQAHDELDHVGADKAKSTMMPRRFERVCQGALFSWGTQAICQSDLDVDTLNVAAAAFLARARVGGKRGTGHGLLVPIAARHIELLRPSDTSRPLDTKALAPKVGQLFRAHVAERSERIKSFLGTVNA